MDEEEFYLIDLKSKFDKIKPNTYYLTYSGGKDSHFIYWFIKEYLKRDDIKKDWRWVNAILVVCF